MQTNCTLNNQGLFRLKVSEIIYYTILSMSSFGWKQHFLVFLFKFKWAAAPAYFLEEGAAFTARAFNTTGLLNNRQNICVYLKAFSVYTIFVCTDRKHTFRSHFTNKLSSHFGSHKVISKTYKKHKVGFGCNFKYLKKTQDYNGALWESLLTDTEHQTLCNHSLCFAPL